MKSKYLNQPKFKRWYQSIDIGNKKTISNSDARSLIRTNALLKFVPQVLRSDDKVLDIGCNAGLYSLTASQICKEVLGIDISEGYIEQANFVKSIWETEGKNVSNVVFDVCNILEKPELVNGFDVIFACKVLYHRNFVKGIDAFMSHVRDSNVRIILAQGHVTQPKYHNIESMTELFDRYGFDTVVLENVPEYPIVLAIRKGEKLDDKIKPVSEIPRHVEYRNDFDFKKHVRCVDCLKKADKVVENKNVVFDDYRELFERCFVEVGIMNGSLGVIKSVPIGPDPLENTDFARAIGVGVNKFNNARVNAAKQFFDAYEKYGYKKFLRHYARYAPEYCKTISNNDRIGIAKYIKVRNKITNVLQMYENMKVIKNLAPNSLNKKINNYSIWSPEDFPWVIDYFDYLRKKDGSHRRMIMAYFGYKFVDSIVVDFESISESDLDGSLPYLRNNFNWFYKQVKNLKSKT